MPLAEPRRTFLHLQLAEPGGLYRIGQARRHRRTVARKDEAPVIAVLLVIVQPDAGLDRQPVGDLPAQLAEQRRAGVFEILRVDRGQAAQHRGIRSEEHTSELQSLMRISYAVFCLKKKKT